MPLPPRGSLSPSLCTYPRTCALHGYNFLSFQSHAIIFVSISSSSSSSTTKTLLHSISECAVFISHTLCVCVNYRRTRVVKQTFYIWFFLFVSTLLFTSSIPFAKFHLRFYPFSWFVGGRRQGGRGITTHLSLPSLLSLLLFVDRFYLFWIFTWVWCLRVWWWMLDYVPHSHSVSFPSSSGHDWMYMCTKCVKLRVEGCYLSNHLKWNEVVKCTRSQHPLLVHSMSFLPQLILSCHISSQRSRDCCSHTHTTCIFIQIENCSCIRPLKAVVGAAFADTVVGYYNEILNAIG